jgi:hypothetical protein
LPSLELERQPKRQPTALRNPRILLHVSDTSLQSVTKSKLCSAAEKSTYRVYNVFWSQSDFLSFVARLNRTAAKMENK